jgi:hypothetical protein
MYPRWSAGTTSAAREELAPATIGHIPVRLTSTLKATRGAGPSRQILGQRATAGDVDLFRNVMGARERFSPPRPIERRPYRFVARFVPTQLRAHATGDRACEQDVNGSPTVGVSRMNRSQVLGALAAITLPVGLTGEATAQADALTPEAKAARDVVAREVAAFNAHDAATVANMHAPHAAISVIPSGKALARGTKALRAFFARVFLHTPNVHLALGKQYVFGDVVVNHYAVTGGTEPELVAIYHVKNGVIANEWLVFG